MRGQSSVEFVAIIALSLMALLGVWYYANNANEDVKEEIRIAQAQQVVTRLRDAADLVYTQGPPSQFVVDVQVPDLIVRTDVSGRTISVFLVTKATSAENPQQIYATTIGNVTGNLDKFTSLAGLHVVTVKAESDPTYAINNGLPFVNVTD